MQARTLAALFTGAAWIALLHAAIPSHWFSFAAIGRARHWSAGYTTAVAAMAGLGHAIVTTGLGIMLAVAGKEALRFLPPEMEHAFLAASLLGLGAVFIGRELFGRRGCLHGDHHEYAPQSSRVETLTVAGALLLGLTLSPCLDLLPIFIAASRFSWGVIAVLCAEMALITTAAMAVFVALSTHGLHRIRFRWLEHNEGMAVGIVLVAVGVAVLVIP